MMSKTVLFLVACMALNSIANEMAKTPPAKPAPHPPSSPGPSAPPPAPGGDVTVTVNFHNWIPDSSHFASVRCQYDGDKEQQFEAQRVAWRAYESFEMKSFTLAKAPKCWIYQTNEKSITNKPFVHEIDWSAPQLHGIAGKKGARVAINLLPPSGCLHTCKGLTNELNCTHAGAGTKGNMGLGLGCKWEQPKDAKAASCFLHCNERSANLCEVDPLCKYVEDTKTKKWTCTNETSPLWSNAWIQMYEVELPKKDTEIAVRATQTIPNLACNDDINSVDYGKQRIIRLTFEGKSVPGPQPPPAPTPPLPPTAPIHPPAAPIPTPTQPSAPIHPTAPVHPSAPSMAPTAPSMAPSHHVSGEEGEHSNHFAYYSLGRSLLSVDDTPAATPSKPTPPTPTPPMEGKRVYYNFGPYHNMAVGVNAQLTVLTSDATLTGNVEFCDGTFDQCDDIKNLDFNWTSALPNGAAQIPLSGMAGQVLEIASEGVLNEKGYPRHMRGTEDAAPVKGAFQQPWPYIIIAIGVITIIAVVGFFIYSKNQKTDEDGKPLLS